MGVAKKKEIRAFFSPPTKKKASISLTAEVNKDKYYRYELVKIKAWFTDKRNRPITKAKLSAKVFNPQGKLVYTIGWIKSIPLRYHPQEGYWQGKWPPPWNPPLGRYKMVISTTYPFKEKKVIGARRKKVAVRFFPWIKIPYPWKTTPRVKPKVRWEKESKTYQSVCYFEVRGKTPPRMSSHPCIMTLEATGPLLSVKIKSPQGESGDWREIISWAKFLGADAIWYLCGQTARWRGEAPTSSVWGRNNLIIFPRLSKEAHQKGLKFGGWIAAYLIFGNAKPPSSYQYAWNYSVKKKSSYPTRAVSLLDKRRVKDIVNLVKKLSQDPNLDYIGLDYIRFSAGGYEMVDEFVRDMDPSLPSNFSKFNRKQRMDWLGKKIISKRDRNLYEQWNWWRAHKTAWVVAKIIKFSQVKKPLWVFTLSWEHGVQHGQDPLMMNDAGAYLTAAMLYETNRELFSYIMKDWKSYLRPGEVNLVAGNIVDWNLHQKTLVPAGPEEFYDRLISGFKYLNGGDKCQGVFWHDLSRGLWGRKGPYPLLEWAIAGASAYSKVRELWETTPLRLKIKAPPKVSYGQNFKVKVSLKNVGKEKVKNLLVSFFPTEGVHFQSLNKRRLKSIDKDSSEEVTFKVKLNKVSPQRAYRHMLAAKVSWVEEGKECKLVTFSYISGGK